MGRREDEHLPIVRKHLTTQLGRPLRRVDERPDEGPTPDLVTDDQLRPRIAIEVKELVPGEFLAARQAVVNERGLDSDLLSKRWSVLIDEEPLSERLGSMPRFPDAPHRRRSRGWQLQAYVSY
jgi:hypothetical protein